jgi:hypothetical protein
MASTSVVVKADDLLRLSAAAAIAAPRNRKAIHVAAEKGELPFMSIDGVRHFARADVETWAQLRLHEAAQLVNVHPGTLGEAADTGELASMTLAGARYFRPADVVSWSKRRASA